MISENSVIPKSNLCVKEQNNPTHTAVSAGYLGKRAIKCEGKNTVGLYVDFSHAFIGIKNAKDNIKKFIGKYPNTEKMEVPKYSYSYLVAKSLIPTLLTCALLKVGINRGVAVSAVLALHIIPGLYMYRNVIGSELEDEMTHYGTDSEEIDKIPHIDIIVDNEIMKNIENFIKEYPNKRQSFNLIANNCLDFVQEIFQLTGQDGYFVDQFPHALNCKLSTRVKIYTCMKSNLLSFTKECSKINSVVIQMYG